MSKSTSEHTLQLRALPVMLACIVASVVLWSCQEKEKELMKGNFDPESFATMTSTNVNTLISDSGVVRYKIETPLWLVFDQAREPYWNFPKGIHLEKFNDMFHVEAEVSCDSARFFKERQLWRLDGYVEITNIAGEKFLTPQLFWDQRKQELYSDSFIHIERQGRVIEGYGFISNERMTQYEVRKVMGMFPSSDFKPGSGPADSTAPPGAAPHAVAAGPDSTNYAVKTSTH